MIEIGWLNKISSVLCLSWTKYLLAEVLILADFKFVLVFC